MKPMFNKVVSLQFKFLITIMAAIVTIIADSRLEVFTKIRTYMDTVISPFYFIANSPFQILDSISEILETRSQLALENRVLRQELLLNRSDQLLLGQYKKENKTLRELLGSPLRQTEHKMIAQVISTSIDPYKDQIVIDKGLDNNVYVGQPVISEKGIVGQVIATSKFTSRVLLICGASHALPIQVLRNGIRMIVSGNGCTKNLQLDYLPDYIDYVPGYTDIRVGDILVTSGLGGCFPEGYPVAVVSFVKVDTQRAHIMIQARPTAELQHLRHLLLLWSSNVQSEVKSLPSEEVHKVAEQRLSQMMLQMPLSVSNLVVDTSTYSSIIDSKAPINNGETFNMVHN